MADSTEAESQFEADAKIHSKSPRKVFTSEEIEFVLISNALLLFFAGFDTTSSGLALTRLALYTLSRAWSSVYCVDIFLIYAMTVNYGTRIN